MSFKIVFLLSWAMFLNFEINAQRKLAEGILVFDITISGKIRDTEDRIPEQKTGTLTLFVKDDNIRQDIRLEDGYQYSRLINYTTKKELVLQHINTIKYAIETNLSDFYNKVQTFRNAELFTSTHKEHKNGFEALSATLTYKDGSVFPFYYINDYELKHPEIFERMPDLKGIPVVFDLPMNNGFVTHFQLRSITQEPVANTIFRVPEGYRIITKKEYDKLIK